MKTFLKIIAILCVSLFMSCNTNENEIVPDFLDGTEYGVLIDVDVTSSKEASKTNLDAYTLNFEVRFKGENRPVKSISVLKKYNSANTSSSIINHAVLTEFPKSLSLSINDIIANIDTVSKEDLETGDSFNINFVIEYEDGLIVDKFDSSLRTNFIVNIID